jgi:hypothetical protein
MIKICPMALSCPLFNGLIKPNNNDLLEIKSQFCLAGRDKYSYCKRFIISNKEGSAPDDIMPSSTLSYSEV